MQLPADDFLGAGLIELKDAISRPYPSRSTIPERFTLRYDRRLMPGETQESILASMRAALAGLPGVEAGFEEVEIDCYTGQQIRALDYHPGWKTDPASPWAQKAEKALRQAGIEPTLSAAQFCTNGSYTAGIANTPTMIFGPSSGLLAHCVDEYIAIAELLAGAEGYAQLVQELSS